MCSECYQTPCHPRCPNATTPSVLGYCDECGDEIRQDYEYYTDKNENKYCSIDCAISYYGVKAKEWNCE